MLPNGTLASGSSDTTIKLWDTSSGRCLSTLEGHSKSVTALAVLPNGSLASGSWDSTIKLWDTFSGRCLSTLMGRSGWVMALAVLPNGTLASGSFDRTIKLWDTFSGRCLSILSGCMLDVLALAVLPNGTLASAHWDLAIRLWDTSSARCIAILRDYSGDVCALAVFPNGTLASGSSDTTIKLWEPKTKPFSLVTQQIKTILSTLKNNTSVTHLDLSGNQNILDDLIDPLIKLFKIPDLFSFFSPNFRLNPNTTLKTIDLRGTGVSRKGVRKLKKTIQDQKLSVEVLANCPAEWMIIYFLIIFCRANRNSPFADSCLDLCKHGEIGHFLRIPSSFFTLSNKVHKNPVSSKNVTSSPS